MMEKKLFRKLLAILTILMIIATDFFTLGFNLVSYAATAEIEMETYFKDAEGNKIGEELTESINVENLKLCIGIKITDGAYKLKGGEIEILDSNFKIKNNVTSKDILSIEDNRVLLNEIYESVEIELDVEPIISETIREDMLSKTTNIKLTGECLVDAGKDYEKWEPVEKTSSVKLNLMVDENAQAELSTEIITNKVFTVEQANKRIVQLLIRSRLTENQYPVKQTTLNIEVPQLGGTAPEEITVLSLGTLATDGKTEETIDNWKNENGVVTITLSNKANENNEISWKKDVYDNIILTFIYDENVDASKVEMKTTSEIQVFNSNNTYTAEHTVGIENQELNNIIVSDIKSMTADLYKGQLYANVKATDKKEIPFSANTTVEIRNKNIADKITVQEGKDIFTTGTSELAANTKYLSTEINKAKMLEILGENGSIEIKNGETIYNITGNTEVNENGNIVINYETVANTLEITISKPIKEGKLEIYHSKAIAENTYTTEQLKSVNALKMKNTIIATLGETKVVENTTETAMELKETISKAELTVNKENLSTITKNEQVVLGIKLIADNVKYDLYKNPTVKIQLPSSVEDINVNSINKLYGDEFEIKAAYDKANKIIKIDLTGEQLQYIETQATQLYLQINLDITLSKLTPSKTEKITVQYINENATQYEGNTTDAGVIEKNIGISSPSGLVMMNNTNTYNIMGISGISDNKQMIQVLKSDASKEINFDIALINNTGADMNNVRILGKLPTDGNKTTGEETLSTLTTQLKTGISASNATVYYSENADATSDITDSTNGWTSNLSQLSNPRVYLITLDVLNAESNYVANYTVQLPSVINNDLMTTAEYKVIYDSEQETNIETSSTIISLATATAIKMETTLTAEVGNDILKSGDIVKAGEVIKYTATVKNTGAQTIEDVTLKAEVPDGTVVVEPSENYVYAGVNYYTERPDITEEIATIPTLAAGETYTIQYEVRVKSDITNGKEMTNKTTAICGETTIEGTEIKNLLEESKIRVTIKRADDLSKELLPGMEMNYLAYVENLSNETIQNLEIQFLMNNYEITSVYNVDSTNYGKIEKLAIDEIPANTYKYFNIKGTIAKDVEQINGVVVVTDSNGSTYRSNKNIEKVSKAGAEISLSSPTNRGYINEGDIVEYNIVVENTGNISSAITIVDEISEYLEIQAVYENGVVKMQTTDTTDENTYIRTIQNKLEYIVNIEPSNKSQVTIQAKVKEVTEEFDVKNITNTASAKIYGEIKSTSEETIHILKGKTIIEDVKNVISGIAWLDSNWDGEKNNEEIVLSGIKVRLYDISTNNYLKDEYGNIIETETNENGQYTFIKIKNGNYIVLFEYDFDKYEPTTYQKEGVDNSKNSKAILKNITIDGEEKTYAVTDTLNLEDNIYNINIGLKEKRNYDLELYKYINKIVIQNSKETKTYDCENSTFEKVEIAAKQLKGSVVILEYTIKVKNNGEIPGYVSNIVDYLPNGLAFSSELNPDWYLSGNNLYTKGLASEKINAGEEKEIKLILTKTMTENNTGLINNSAEIYETYNEYGNTDIDSTPNNQVKGEDDMGIADVIISIKTGGTMIAYIILVMINTGLILIAIHLILKNNKREIKLKKERR